MQNDYFASMYEYPVKAGKVEYTELYKKTVEAIYYNNDDGEHAMAFELNPVVVTSQLVTLKNSPSPLPNYPLRRKWIRDTIDMKSYVHNNTVGTYVVSAYRGVREYLGYFSERIERPQDSFGPLESGTLIGPKKSAARQYHYAEKIIELRSVGDSGHKSGVLSQIYE